MTRDAVPLYYGQSKDQFSNLKLVSQKEIEGTGGQQWMRRIWATERAAEDAEALSVKYTSDSQTSPVFIRQYVLLLPVTPLTAGTPLTAVIGIVITNGGAGYTSAPALSFSGGGGAGAAAKCQIRDGVIVGVQMTASGSGYTTTPTVSLSGGGGSAGAFTASIQPQSALLVSQEQKPAEGELGMLFAEVTRVWRTLPGPALTTTRLDDDGNVVTVTRTDKVLADIASSEALAAGVWTKITKGEGNAVYATEVREARAIPGNAIVSVKTDEDGMARTTSRRRAASGITGAEAESGGTWTKVYSEPITDLVDWEITESRAVPGNLIATTRLDDDGNTVTVSRTLKKLSDITTSEALSGGIWTRTTRTDAGSVIATELQEARAIPGAYIVTSKKDEDGILRTTRRRRRKLADIAPNESITSDILTIIRDEAITELVGWEIEEKRAIPGNTVVTYENDAETLTPVEITTTLVAALTSPPAQIEGTSAHGAVLTFHSNPPDGAIVTLHTDDGTAFNYEFDEYAAGAVSGGALITFADLPRNGDLITLTRPNGNAFIFEFGNDPANGHIGVPLAGTVRKQIVRFAGAVSRTPFFSATAASDTTATLARREDGSANETITGQTGVLQVEALGCAGTVTLSGNATVIVTADGMSNSPKTVPFAVLLGDDNQAQGAKARAALALDADVSAFFTVSGATSQIILTTNVKAANDDTMAMATDNDTCTGITPETSAHAIAGVAEAFVITSSFSGGANASAVIEGNHRVTLGADANASAAAFDAALDTLGFFSGVTAPGPIVTLARVGHGPYHTANSVSDGSLSITDFTGGEGVIAAVEYHPITDVYGKLITSRLLNYALCGRVEPGAAAHDFPALVTGVSVFVPVLETGEVRPQINWSGRSGGERTVDCATFITYGPGPLPTPAVWSLAKQDLEYTGTFLHVHRPKVLNDYIELRFTTGTENPRYGYIGEDVYFPASNPPYGSMSAALYYATMGTSRVIGVSSGPWKYGLHKRGVKAITQQ